MKPPTAESLKEIVDGDWKQDDQIEHEWRCTINDAHWFVYPWAKLWRVGVTHPVKNPPGHSIECHLDNWQEALLRVSFAWRILKGNDA